MLTDLSVSDQGRSAYSLTHALCRVLDQTGAETCADELHSVLGLGLLVCAASDEPVPNIWSAYARDAFLVEAAQLYGATVRPIHPPSAARGLNGREEFRQHFDASYAPLVLRALEHGQSVLIWGGWAKPYSRDWGSITETSSDGLGFCGAVYPRVSTTETEASSESSPLVVQSPPAQVHVVETTTGRRPSRSELMRSIVVHTQSALNGVIDEAFGVVTGVHAIDLWLERLDSEATSGDGFLRAIATSAQSLQRTLAKNDVDDVPEALPLSKACESLIARIGDVGADPRSVGVGVRDIFEQIARIL